jgi:DNA (cytosine-5)-methyltransferase 1
MMDVFKDLDYDVLEPVLFNSMYYNVPQKRERLFILGIRKDISINPFSWPEPDIDNIVTLKDTFFKGKLYDTDVPLSNGQSYSEKKLKVMKLVPEGGNWKDLPVKVQKEYMLKTFYSTGGRTGIAKRLSFSEPSLTILCSPSQKQTERCHPSENRPLTIRESARIQTFPDDWVFLGSICSQYRQIGNAVPVNLAHKIGSKIIEYLENI